MAACFAAKGHKVIGVDLNEQFVADVNAKKAPVFEPGLQELIEKCDDRLTATTDLHDAVKQCEATFIIVPTPSKADGAFSLDYTKIACQTIGAALKENDRYHLVVLTSTVMPGDTGVHIRKALEDASGKTCGKDFGLCYSPEFISLGSVINDYLRPDFTLVGQSDEKAGKILEDFYGTICENDPPVARMNFVNAELTKLSLNAYVTMKISYANTLAEICEKLDGGNIDDVTNAIGLDSRIGRKYLKGATGYAGPCFPRDCEAVAQLGRTLNVETRLPIATDQVNKLQIPRMLNLIDQALPQGGTVGILGLAYKPDTDVIERSQGVELAEALLDRGTTVVAYDPAAMENAQEKTKGALQLAASADDCLSQVDLLVITTPINEYKELSLKNIQGKTIVDCWRILDRSQLEPLCNYVGVGTDDVLRVQQDAENLSAKAA